jgi:hypothetical protein
VLDITITADAELIDPASLRLETWLESGEGEQFRLPLNKVAGQGARAEIDLMSFAGPRRIALKASAKAQSGESVSYFDTPIEVEGMKAPEPVVVAQPEPTPAPVPEPEPQPEPEPEVEETGGWGSALIWFGVINLILILGAGGAFWWIRMRNQRSIVNLVDDTQATMVESDKTDGATAGESKGEGND